MFLRPYISRELPAWGPIYKALVGDFDADQRWTGFKRRWERGKFHEYEMSLDLGYWSNRAKAAAGPSSVRTLRTIFLLGTINVARSEASNNTR